MKKFIERRRGDIEWVEEFTENILFVGVLFIIYGLYHLEKATRKIKKNSNLGISDAIRSFPFPVFFEVEVEELDRTIDRINEGIMNYNDYYLQKIRMN